MLKVIDLVKQFGGIRAVDHATLSVQEHEIHAVIGPNGAGKTTLVAQLAGVSVATVSRAIRGLPNVSPATRDRVLKAAEELHYVAHPHASRLAAGRTMTVGMAVPLLTQWFFTQVVAGAEAVLAANGYDVLLYGVPDPRHARLREYCRVRSPAPPIPRRGQQAATSVPGCPGG